MMFLLPGDERLFIHRTQNIWGMTSMSHHDNITINR